MRAASTALINFLNAAIATPDAPLAFADCFTFTLADGTVLTYTNVDQPIVFSGVTYSASGPLVQGLKYKSSVGLDVDKQQITIAARPTDMLGGDGLLAAIANGALDGATVQRDRAFMTALGGAVVGLITLFHGRVSTVDEVGRTQAKITVASNLVQLDYEMPQNLYAATCVHTLYDAGCTVVRSTYTTSGTVGPAPTTSLIPWTGAAKGHSQGSILFTSGANVDIRATIKSVTVGVSLSLLYQLPETPSAGDAFSATFGCDHTAGTCRSRFANQANFRAFPFVPPPQQAY
jgi:uncharacterized phage protein (TIGR02218 family)